MGVKLGWERQEGASRQLLRRRMMATGNRQYFEAGDVAVEATVNWSFRQTSLLAHSVPQDPQGGGVKLNDCGAQHPHQQPPFRPSWTHVTNPRRFITNKETTLSQY